MTGGSPLFVVRDERAADIRGVHQVESSAFPGSGEADLVDTLRACARPFLSIVAEADGGIIGHVAFSPVAFDPMRSHVELGLGLAPLAVVEEWRGRGVGSALVNAGLDQCREMGASIVVVLGDPAFYGRFGFKPASDLGLRCVYDGPPEAFQALALRPFERRPGSTTVLFRPEFDAVS